MAAVLLAAAPAFADLDLTGRWRTNHDVDAQIVQTGDQVAVSFSRTFAGTGTVDFQMTGTFDQAVLAAKGGNASVLGLRSYGEGTYLEGVLSLGGSLGGESQFWTRCECFDGNGESGDGCDAQCQIEPCFACTAEPSVCTPSADGDVCDDHRDCTSGETCTAGVCGNGTAVPSCIDLTGRWRLSTRQYVWIFNQWEVSAGQLDLVQQRGALFAGGAFGSIDPATGAFRLFTRGGGLLCSISYGFDGTASPDGLGFSGSGATYFSHIRGCWTGSTFDQQGTRCNEDTGCDLQDCSTLPDGTACNSQDTCSVQGTCLAGACVPLSTCPLCTTCDGAGSCVEKPRPDCTASLQPSKSQLQITDSADDAADQLRWKWKAGPALSAEHFGNPQTSDDVALCVYSEQPDGPVLVFGANLPAGNCAKPPCWVSKNGKLSYKAGGDVASPITGITLRSGADGKTSAELRAAGSLLAAAGPFAPPLLTPLRTQLQIGNSACLEVDFSDTGVQSNEPGSFRAAGSALPAAAGLP